VDLTEEFRRRYPFELDPFQTEAIEALAAGRTALVCAPTGAGKTVVGEFGVWLALRRGTKAFYTTPIKALSNQKFGDFIAQHGADHVGLLTGDNSINGEASIVVMTTEVLRNMLYEGSPTLRGLGLVVMDEVHYLQDPYRGAVWEEVFIHLPPEVKVAALSATVSNAEEFGAWLRTVRGPTDVVIETKRPVPLEHRYMVGEKLHPMFVSNGERRPNPTLMRLGRDPRGRGRGERGRRTRPRFRPPDRVAVVGRLAEQRLVPAITFIFSRAGCDQAVRQCISAGVRLTNAEEAERVREYVEMRANVLPPDDLAVLGYDAWLEGLTRGVGAHHAGLVPLFKETVEELFQRALVKAVFATETLALGINMPAKTVVIERPIKFTGERHEFLTPVEYTQLTGRAGRRGIDPVGFGVMLAQEDIPFTRIAELVSARSFPLTSSFRPSYNMAVNLVARYDIDEAKRLLNLSFAQFLTDKGLSKLTREIERNERFLEGYREHVRCDRGDFEEYWRLARELRGRKRDESERRRRHRLDSVREAFGALRPGQVLQIGRGKRAGLAAVLEVRRGRSGEPQPVVMTEGRQIARLATRDFREAPGVVGEVRLPRGDPRRPAFRHDVARQLHEIDPLQPTVPGSRARSEDPAANALEERVRAHPVYDCPDREEHERWAERIDALERDTADLRRRVGRRSQSLARTFERVLDVLSRFGYVDDGKPTEKGEVLRRIYNESDLILAESLERGVFDGLDTAELAAVVSTLVYETRSPVPREPAFPNDRVRRAFGQIMRGFREIGAAEDQLGLELCREPDPGFVEVAYWWAREEPLEEVLDLADLSAGDFVRSAKQVWDLLRQIEEAAPTDALASRCRDAAKLVYRGVVAASGAL
jgi:ATP-dependent RNA helicase HelY